MIWYRHWLELRGPAKFIGAAAVAATLFYAFAAWRGIAWFRESGRILDEIDFLVKALPGANTETILAAGPHALVAGFFLAFAFAGVAARPTYFTLSLPVSRRTYLWTRLAASSILLAVAHGFLLAAHSLLSLLIAGFVPFAEMAWISVNAMALSSGLYGAASCLARLGPGHGALTLAILPMTILYGWLLPRSIRLVAAPPNLILLLLAAAALAALATWLEERKEY